VTHFGHFGVTKRLLPVLQKTSLEAKGDEKSKPRVIVLSSMMHLEVKETHFSKLLRWKEVEPAVRSSSKPS
jgi:NAD(P)-dependent dehydrogenase (short-subunit alcohol dehydrogenase family)